MNETIIIYHGGCRDGFCAAWVVNKYFHDMANQLANVKMPVYHPGYYGQEPPDCKGKDVIIVDFAYPLEQMNHIYADCKRMIWLDHHKTAQPIADYFINQNTLMRVKISFIFDNNRSGAGIAWDYFFSNEARPWLVDYVEDRDLWLHKLPNSESVNALISVLEFNFEVWDKASNGSLEEAKTYGYIAQRKTEQYVREVCKNVYIVDISYPGSLEDLENAGLSYTAKRIPVVNICQVDCSEVLHQLCLNHPDSLFSLYWFKRADGMYQYGLRSIGDFDVSTVAKLFGGGGHKNAAGFQLTYLLEELK